MVGQVVKGASGAACGLNVLCAGHCTDEGRDHLWGVHDCVATGLLLRQLMHHHGGLVHNNLVFIIQQLDQLRDSTGCKVSIILDRW